RTTMRTDVHFHIVQRCRPFQQHDRLSFEPVEGDAPADAYLSPRLTGGLEFPLLKRWLGLPRRIPHEQFDAVLEQFCLEQILNSEQVDRVVVLAMDQYHTDAGEPL